MPTLPRVDAVTRRLRITHPKRAARRAGRWVIRHESDAVGSAGEDRHHERHGASTTRTVSRTRHGAGIHHERATRGGEPARVHGDGEVGGGAQGAHEQPHGQGAEVGDDRARRRATRRRGRGPGGPGRARARSRRSECTRCRAAEVATTGRSGSRSRWARGSPRASGSIHGISTADGQHDDEHAQADGERRVEVAAGEEPGRPAAPRGRPPARGPSARATRRARASATAAPAGRPEADHREHQLGGEHREAGRPVR